MERGLACRLAPAPRRDRVILGKGPGIEMDAENCRKEKKKIMRKSKRYDYLDRLEVLGYGQIDSELEIQITTQPFHPPSSLSILPSRPFQAPSVRFSRAAHVGLYSTHLLATHHALAKPPTLSYRRLYPAVASVFIGRGTQGRERWELPIVCN